MRVANVLAIVLQLILLSCQTKDQQEKTPPVSNSEVSNDTLLALYNNAEGIRQQSLSLEGEPNQKEAAIEKYQEAIVLFRALVPKMAEAPDSIKGKILLGIFKSTQNQSNCYYDTENYEKAYPLQQQCLAFLDSLKQYQQVFDWKIERSILAYHYMGRIQDKRDNLDEAIRNYQTAHTLCIQTKGKYAERCRDMYVDYSNVYLDWQEADSIIHYAELAIATGYEDSDSHKPFINSGIGYGLEKNYSKALAQYDSVLAKNPGEDMAKDRHNRAWLYLESADYPKAIKYVQQAISLNSKQSKNSPVKKGKLAGNYSLKGDILRELKSYDPAIKDYDRALSMFANIPVRELKSDHFLKLEPETIYGEDRITILEALLGKATTLIAQKNPEAALPWYDAAIHLTNRFRQAMPDQSSKIKLATLTKKIFEGAINTSLALSKNEAAFIYAEQSKSFALLEGVLQLKAIKRLPDIDPKLQESWNEARIEITRLNKKIDESGDSVELVLELRKEMSNQQAKLHEIDQAFQKNEAYVKLTTALNPPDISDIQKNLLADNQALVEYFIGENQSYLFYIPKNGALKIHTLNITRETLAQQTDSLLLAIRLPHTDLSDINDEALKSFYRQPDMEMQCNNLYAKHAFELYDKLLAVVRPSPAVLPERLVIIPDDVLGYLPFDALLTMKPGHVGNYADYAYLWKSPCYISYCYSGALLKEMSDHNQATESNQMLAFGYPGKGFKDQIGDLKKLFNTPWSIFSGDFKVIKTKSRLIDLVLNTRYLHFSTHGHVDDRNPNYSYLDMSQERDLNSKDNRLYLYDIYNLKLLKTALVVTSACETGLGRLYQGEGIISLARGFSAAGASSIITTLWSVYQTESGEIFTNFYRNLMDGKTSKDMALSKAKATFFEGKDHAEVAPFYWAGIVPVGEMASVSLPQKPSLWPSLLALGALLIAIRITLYLLKPSEKK